MTPNADEAAHSARVLRLISQHIRAAGGFLGFAAFMDLALYAPGLGYYSAGSTKFGAAGDFTTAPEMSDLFARCVARQCAAGARGDSRRQHPGAGRGQRPHGRGGAAGARGAAAPARAVRHPGSQRGPGRAAARAHCDAARCAARAGALAAAAAGSRTTRGDPGERSPGRIAVPALRDRHCAAVRRRTRRDLGANGSLAWATRAADRGADGCRAGTRSAAAYGAGAGLCVRAVPAAPMR